MNTGSGSVFHRRGWVNFRATLTLNSSAASTSSHQKVLTITLLLPFDSRLAFRVTRVGGRAPRHGGTP